MYRNKGKIDMAVKNLLISININKFYFKSYFELSSISDLSKDKEKLHFLLNLNFDKLNIQDKIDVAFTISNIYHQQKNFDKIIQYLKLANNTKLKFKESNLKLIFTVSEYFRNLTINFNNTIQDNTQYIFIVGMPRSGSTLAEQILSLNSDVIALGEVNYFEKSLRTIKKIEDIYLSYITKIKKNFKTSKIYIDKNLFNFFYCKVIFKFFPQAKIINCSRNPFDRNNFLNQNFSSSFEDILKLYIYYNNLMTQYNKLYSDKIFNCCYEELVNNPSNYIPKIIKWLDWKWEKKFLDPQKNKRNIITASSVQVRKSINNKAIGKWKNYKPLFIDYLHIIKNHKNLFKLFNS